MGQGSNPYSTPIAGSCFELIIHAQYYAVEYQAGFKTRGIRDSGGKEDEGDTVYLLAKELAYNVLSDQTDKLAASLAKVSGNDIVAFAQALKVSDADTEKKLCYGGASGTTTANSTEGCTTKKSTTGAKEHGIVSFYVDEKTNPPLWPGKKQGEAGNGGATSVAKNMTALTKDEKAVVAGHLAKSIEGGEVAVIKCGVWQRELMMGCTAQRVWIQSYCIKNAFAQALKVSDADIDKKICKNGRKHTADNSNTTHGGACNGQVSSQPTSWTQSDPGLARALTGVGEGKWPMISVGTTSAATADGSGHVASDIASLTKDEKVKVAGHRDVFSSYNRDSKM